MKHKVILETIDFPTGAITQTLTRWAKDYGMEQRTVYARYYDGKRGYELIDPLNWDKLSYEDVCQLWKKGRWIYNGAKAKKIIKKFRTNQRWVYVGK